MVLYAGAVILSLICCDLKLLKTAPRPYNIAIVYVETIQLHWRHTFESHSATTSFIRYKHCTQKQHRGRKSRSTCSAPCLSQAERVECFLWEKTILSCRHLDINHETRFRSTTALRQLFPVFNQTDCICVAKFHIIKFFCIILDYG